MKYLKKRLGISAVSVAIAVFSISGFADQWNRVKQENGIEVFSRPVSGSEFIEVRVVTVVKGRISSALALLDNTPSYPAWMYRCTESALLSKKNIYERITYTVTASPWPVDDRDIAIKSVITQDKKTGIVTVTLNGLPDYIPEKPGRVRMTALRGYWKFEPLGNGNIRITNQIHSEPGGSVPDSLVNSSLIEIPYFTLYNMRRLITESPYRDAVYSGITEK